jgi:hypothetical protein
VGSSVGEFAALPTRGARARRTRPARGGFNEALRYGSPSLVNLTFHRSKALKVPDGKIAIAKLAALRFKRIIWLRRGGSSTNE